MFSITNEKDKMIEYLQIAIYSVLGLIAYLVFIYIMVNLMSDEKYKHYHGYQDIREKANEKLDKKANEKFLELLQENAMIEEAISELPYDAEFIEQLISLMDAKNYLAIGELVNKEIKQYLSSVADEITTEDF